MVRWQCPRGPYWTFFWPGQAWTHDFPTPPPLHNLPLPAGIAMLIAFYAAGFAIPIFFKRNFFQT
jgi:hypothetical protein